MAAGRGTDVGQIMADLDEPRRAAIAAVGHRLRTPLAVAQALVDERCGAGAVTFEESDVEVLAQQLRAVHADAELLLEVAGWPGAPQRRPLDLAEEVRRVLAAAHAELTSRHVELDVTLPESLVVPVDPAPLRWLVRAVVAQASQACERGAHVTVTLSEEPPTLRIVTRGRPAGPPTGWRGAERALAEHVVQRHDGELTVAATADGADELRVQLGRPVLATPDPEVPPRSASSADGPAGAPLVLVVEDDDALRDFLHRTLSGDYQVVAVASGPEALDAARELLPDLIVCDLILPGGSGEDVVAEVTADPELAAIPVMVLSGRTDEEVRTRLLRAGADDYVVKPFSLLELRARIANLVAHRLDERALQRRLHDTTTLAEQLQHALDSRVLIEQAKGFIAAEQHLTLDAAFEVLRRQARSRNRPLRDVAGEVLGTGAPPPGA